MVEKLKSFISSRWLTLALLAIYAVVLAVATFVESRYSTQVAKEVIYNSVWFIALHLLMIINFCAILLKGGYCARHRWGVVVTHTAFIVILVGAITTHLTGEEGVIEVREGERTSVMKVQMEDMQKIVNLPFQIELKDFELTRYPGSSSPSSYDSHIVIHSGGESREEHIYMNNTLDVMGYRLFQASYHPDEKGTVLIVNADVAGRVITYVGYCLLALGLVISLFIRNGRIAVLFSKLSNIKRMAMVLVGVLSLSATYAKSPQLKGEAFEFIEQHAVPAEHAAKFGELPMQNAKGRLMPVNSFASEILRKLHKEKSIGSMNAEQFLLSLWLMPDIWMGIEFVEYNEEYLEPKYNMPAGGYFSFADIFDDKGEYRFQQDLELIYAKSVGDRTKSDSELLKIDEKVNILDQLFRYEMIRLFPDEEHPNHLWYAPGDDLSVFEGNDSLFVGRVFHWYLSEVGESLTSDVGWSEAERVLAMIPIYQNAKGEGAGLDYEKIETELKYNRMNPFARSKVLYLILGGILLVISLMEMTHPRQWIKYAKLLLWIAVLCTFHLQMLGMALRWQIGGYGPWSNSYETMIYIAWVAAMAGLLFAKRITFVFAVATLFAGVVLFVSGLNWMDPEITPLVPVLKSRWLMFHVATVVAAYGLFGICSLLGIINMVLMIIRGSKSSQPLDKGIAELTVINEISMWFGLILLAVGIFLGAVWANEAWGRYWGWDPKETWALITMVIYAAITHLYIVGRGAYSKLSVNFLSTIAIVSVLMTYFGVNYFLAGMHSYNSSSLPPEILMYVTLGVVAIVGFGAVAKIRYRE